jgi:hypothetical protein
MEQALHDLCAHMASGAGWGPAATALSLGQRLGGERQAIILCQQLLTPVANLAAQHGSEA